MKYDQERNRKGLATNASEGDGADRSILVQNGKDKAWQYQETCEKCGARRTDRQLGLERVHDCLGWATGKPCGECYVCHLVAVMREVKRVLRDDGVLFLNLGDSYSSDPAKGGSGTPNGRNNRGEAYGRPSFRRDRRPREDDPHKGAAGLKPKDLCGIPWRTALALQADGWWLRSDVIWAKPNPMPESVTDRPTRSHEYVFILTKSARYYWDAEAVKESAVKGSANAGHRNYRPAADNGRLACGQTEQDKESGRNLRSVWTITTKPNSDSWPDFDASDYVGGDGKPYIASPDCPVHGRLAGRRTQQMASGDAQLDLPALRNLGIDAHRAARRVPSPDANALTTSDKTDAGTSRRRSAESMEPSRTQAGQSLPEDGQGGSGETPCRTNRSAGSATLGAGSSGSPQPDSVAPATESSSENRRTGRAQLTTSPCSVSDGTSDRIGDTSGQLRLAGAADRTSESSSGQADLGGHPSAGTQSRSVHKSSYHNSTCKCTISQVAHFATFPPDIPERCIKAATSERGVCPKCGKQWIREVVTVGHQVTPAMRVAGCDVDGEYHGTETKDYEPSGAQAPGETKKRILEAMSRVTESRWRPGCNCSDGEAEWYQCNPAIPATVLDPFGGAGTVGMVAAKLGRSSVSLELNPAYCAIARQRIEAATRQGRLELAAP